MIHFSCGHCGKALKVKEDLAGKKGKCPGCGHPMQVPTESPVEPTSSNKTSAPAKGVPSTSRDVPEEQTLPPRPRKVDEEATHAPAAEDQDSQADAGKTGTGRKAGPATRTAAHAEDDADNEDAADAFDFLAPPQQPDEIGRLGPYRILKVLGAGGMGVVFKAEDPKLKRLVAIKAMLPSMAGSGSAKKRFLREAQSAAALKHDNIVAIYQVDEDCGAPYLAMEFLKGEPLDERLKRDKKLPLADVLRIGREVAEGLAAAHAENMIHRDIKPANVWLEARRESRAKSGEPNKTPRAALDSGLSALDSFRCKILDFGLARSMGDETALTQTGAVVGTPQYMAPEQAGGSKKIDHRCDLFSLGAMLYRLVTGELPFKGDDTISILSALALDNPPEPSQLDKKIPAGLSNLIMHLLAKKPEERPESAHVVAEALAALEAGEKVAVPKYVNRAARRKRLLISGGVAAALFLAVGGFFVAKMLGTPDQGNVAQGNNDKPPDSRWVLDSLTPAVTQKFQDFEWPPPGLVLALGRQGGRHWGPVRSVAYSPDGKLVASAGDDQLIFVWDAETLQHRRLLRGHVGSVRSICFTPDSERILSGGTDKTLRLWDVKTGKELLNLEGHSDPVACVAISEDGKSALSGGAGPADCTVRLWDLAGEGKELKRMKDHTGGVNFVAFAPDGRTAVSGSKDKSACEWNLEDGSQVRQVKLGGESPGVVGVSFGARQLYCLTQSHTTGFDFETGKLLNVIHGSSQSCRSWASAADGKLAVGHPAAVDIFETKGFTRIRSFKSPTEVGCVAFAKDGLRVMSGSADGAVRIWDIENGREIAPLVGHVGRVNTVAVSDDGLRAATGGADKSLRVWELNSSPPGKELLQTQGHAGSVNSVAFSTEHYAVSGGAGTIRFWDLATGKEVNRFEGTPSQFAMSVSQQKLLASGAVPQFWDIATGQKLRDFHIPFPVVATPGSLTPDGRFVLLGRVHTQAFLCIYDPVAGKELNCFGVSMASRINTIGCSADSQFIIAGSDDGAVRVWKIDTLKPDAPKFLSPTLLLGHDKTITGVAYAPDGIKVAASAVDGKILVWDPATRKKIQEWQFPGPVQGITFSADSRYLATANANGTAYILRVPQAKTEVSGK